MNNRTKTLVGSFIASVLSLCGCAPNALTANGTAQANLTIIEEVKVTGFDSEGEPCIRKLSDGSLWIHFEAMPPFFAEDAGIESSFDAFELKIQEALGVPVSREDRELFVIRSPAVDTAEKAKAWLEGFRTKNGS